MSAVSIGPLLFAGERFAILFGLAVFLIATAILGRRIDPRLGRWSNLALIAGLIGGRLGHVAQHASAFLAEPARIFAIWEGGFSFWWAAAAILAVSVATLRGRRLAGFAALALALALSGWSVAHQLVATSSPAAAPPPPTTAFQGLNGQQLTLIQTDGKPTVVNLWASWCPPCVREMPMLARVSAGRSDVNFLFVNQGESADKVKAYLDRAQLTLGHVVLDPASEVARHYGLPGLPVTLFIGADGKVRSTHIGEISPEDLDDGIALLKKG